MLRAKPWARTRGVEEHSSLEHIVVRSGVHTYKDQCALHSAHTGRSVCTYKDQCAHIQGPVGTHTWSSVCTAHTWRTVCSHTSGDRRRVDQRRRRRCSQSRKRQWDGMKRTVEKTNKPRRKFSEKRVKLLFFVGEAVDQSGRIKRKNLKVPIKSSIPVMVWYVGSVALVKFCFDWPVLEYWHSSRVNADSMTKQV